MRLISGKNDWKRVFEQTVATLNTPLHKRQGIVGACSTQIHSDDKGGSW